MAAAPRQQTQLSMFGYLTGQPRAPAADAPARDAGAQKEAEQEAEKDTQKEKQKDTQKEKQKDTQKEKQKGERKAARKDARKAARKAGGKTSGKRKKNTQTSLDEEAIDETDNEQEEEEAPNSDDEAFISDGEHDITGAEQRAMDASTEHDSGTELEQFHEAVDRASGRKKRAKGAREDLEEPAKKKERSKQRDLQVLPERGRGDTRRLVAEYAEKPPFFLPCGSFVTPWDKQPERSVLDFGNDRGRLAEGAFRSDAHARWLNSDEQQENFAERFSVPINETYPLKSVSTDVPNTPLDPRRCLSNSTTKVLHCVRTMHEQTELDPSSVLFAGSNVHADLFAGSNVHADDASDGGALDSPPTGRCPSGSP
jgi:hypothetical protein